MSFFVELTVEGKVYPVRRYFIKIVRDEDDKGRPQSNPTWKIIVLMDKMQDNTIVNWMLDPKRLIDGKLSLYKLDGSVLKEIEFKHSSCSLVYDHFNINYSFMASHIFITGQDMKINTAELKQAWPGH